MAFLVDWGSAAMAPEGVRKFLASETARRMVESSNYHGAAVVNRKYKDGRGQIREGWFLSDNDKEEPLFLLEQNGASSGAMLSHKAVPAVGTVRSFHKGRGFNDTVTFWSLV